jgi:CelD/BcsL family acetyltransferase involved in cellulose biosynthesis
VQIDREPPSAGVFEEMISVERESWKWERGLSMLREPRTRDFLRAVVLCPEIEQELWTLRVGGELGAFAIVLLGGRCRYYYLPSFRARFHDTGAHLLAEIVQRSFAEGFREVDLLQGDEPYKLVWANAERIVHEIASGHGVRGRAATATLRARWWLARSERLKRWRRELRVRWARSAAG